MFKKNNFPFLAIISIIIIIFSILNKSFLISALYILSILIASYIIKDKSIYNLLYATLLVSLFFDYSLHIPHIEKMYVFHIVLLLFTILSLYKLFKNKSIFLKLDRKILMIYLIWFIYICISITWALNKQLLYYYFYFH